MMREYGVEECSEECGRTVLAGHDTHWIIWEFAGEVMVSKGHVGYCPACGTRVGINVDGSWRERMVPVSALEWMADNRHHVGCPAEWHIAPLPCSVDAKCHHKENREMCWAEVAVLKSAEEAPDEDRE